MRAAIVLVLLAGCSGRCEAPGEADAGPVLGQHVAAESSGEGDQDAGLAYDPCGRSEVTWLGSKRVEIALPCRPYDRARDLPDPPF